MRETLRIWAYRVAVALSHRATPEIHRSDPLAEGVSCAPTLLEASKAAATSDLASVYGRTAPLERGMRR